ncbi:MAG: hypothetical protein EOO28_25375 [Comamonadaceae bacterium]|nr:MAG: hypothetical protein EOO28_25375 [Comamonadaceae bacterium]
MSPANGANSQTNQSADDANAAAKESIASSNAATMAMNAFLAEQENLKNANKAMTDFSTKASKEAVDASHKP